MGEIKMKTIKQTIQAVLSTEDLTLDVNLGGSFEGALEQIESRCFEVLGDLDNLISEHQTTRDVVIEYSLYELLGLIKSKTQDECKEEDDYSDYLRLKQEALSSYRDNQEVISFLNSPIF